MSVRAQPGRVAAVVRIDWATCVLIATAAAAFSASLYARVGPALPVIFPNPGQVRLLDTDSYYHLRHTAYAVTHFPEVQRWDVGTGFPQGERSPHAGLFHIALAAACLLVGGATPPHETIGTVLAWAPIVLYVVSAFLLAGLTRSLLDVRYAAFSLAVFSLFPGLSFARTLLGFADHHAAELALMLWTLWGLCAALNPGKVSKLRRMSHALPLLLFQFTWSGAPLMIALVGATIGVLLVVDISRDGDCRPTSLAALNTGTVSAAGLFILHSLLPDAIMIERLYLPSLAASLGLAALGVVGLRYGAKLARERAVVLASVSLLVLLAVGLGLWSVPAEYRALLLEPKTALVQEQQAVSAADFLWLQGSFGVLSCCAVPLFWVAAHRHARFRPQLAGALVATLTVGLWLFSHDYSYLPPALLALGSALSVSGLSTLLPWLGGERRALTLALGLGSLQLWPFASAPPPFSAEPRRLLQIDSAWIDAMAWLKANTPEPLPSVSSKQPGWPEERYAFTSRSYGVLSAWDFGNFVSALGDRTPVASHGFSSVVADWLVSQTEQTSLERLCPSCGDGQAVRYVVLSAPTLAEHFLTNLSGTLHASNLRTVELGVLEHQGQKLPLVGYGAVYDHSTGARLYLNDGNGLQHYRLVYASAEQTWSSYERHLPGTGPVPFEITRVSLKLDNQAAIERAEALRDTPLQPVELNHSIHYGHTITASVKIFEVVRGARLRGIAWSGASLTSFLGLEARGKRLLVYQQTASASPSGAFELTIPYASEGGSSVVKADAPLQLHMASADGHTQRTFQIVVSERAVQAGEEVALGDLRAATH